MTIAVVTDSSASIPSDVARRWGITVVPLKVIAGEESRDEGVDVDADQVVSDLERGVVLRTSQPGPEAFIAAYRHAAAGGATGIVSIHLSSELSGTVNSAQQGAADATVPVIVIDSRTVSMGTGFAALAAAAVARAGGGLEAVADAARATAASSVCAFTVDTLEYMRRSGRVSGPQAAMGRALGVRPVLGVLDGKVEVTGKVRTSQRARIETRRAVDDAMATMAAPACAILTVGSGAGSQAVERDVRSAGGAWGDAIAGPVSAALAVHAGPGGLALVAADMPPEYWY